MGIDGIAEIAFASVASGIWVCARFVQGDAESAALTGNAVFDITQKRDSHAGLGKIRPLVGANLKLGNIALISCIGVAQKVAKLGFALVGLRKERGIVFRTDKGMHVARGEVIFKLDLRTVVTEFDVGYQHGMLPDCVRDTDNEKIFPNRNDLAPNEVDGLFLQTVVGINIPVVVDERKVLIRFYQVQTVPCKLTPPIDQGRNFSLGKGHLKMRCCNLVFTHCKGDFATALDLFAVSHSHKFIGSDNARAVKRLIGLSRVGGKDFQATVRQGVEVGLFALFALARGIGSCHKKCLCLLGKRYVCCLCNAGAGKNIVELIEHQGVIQTVGECFCLTVVLQDRNQLGIVKRLLQAAVVHFEFVIGSVGSAVKFQIKLAKVLGKLPLVNLLHKVRNGGMLYPCPLCIFFSEDGTADHFGRGPSSAVSKAIRNQNTVALALVPNGI